MPSIGVVWGILVVVGLRELWNYESAPGPPADPPSSWPRDSTVPRPTGRPALLLFVHPHCPCSRATMAEFAKIMTRCGNRVEATVLMLRPADFPKDWAKTGLWDSAAAIPGVNVREDPDGREARLFRATTSGHVLLYSSDGRLEFSGGITGSRGHEGDNAGAAAVVALVNAAPGRLAAASASAGVYGCPLQDGAGSPCPTGAHVCRPR